MRGCRELPGKVTAPVVLPILDRPARISMSVVLPAPAQRVSDRDHDQVGIKHTRRSEDGHHLTGLNVTRHVVQNDLVTVEPTFPPEHRAHDTLEAGVRGRHEVVDIRPVHTDTALPVIKPRCRCLLRPPLTQPAEEQDKQRSAHNRGNNREARDDTTRKRLSRDCCGIRACKVVDHILADALAELTAREREPRGAEDSSDGRLLEGARRGAILGGNGVALDVEGAGEVVERGREVCDGDSTTELSVGEAVTLEIDARPVGTAVSRRIGAVRVGISDITVELLSAVVSDAVELLDALIEELGVDGASSPKASGVGYWRVRSVKRPEDVQSGSGRINCLECWVLKQMVSRLSRTKQGVQTHVHITTHGARGIYNGVRVANDGVVLPVVRIRGRQVAIGAIDGGVAHSASIGGPANVTACTRPTVHTGARRCGQVGKGSTWWTGRSRATESLKDGAATTRLCAVGSTETDWASARGPVGITVVRASVRHGDERDSDSSPLLFT